MDLQQWFYLLGIIFIVSWLLVLIALIGVGVVAYRRYRQLKQNVATKGAKLFAATSMLSNLPLTKIITVAGVMPLLTHVAKLFSSKKSGRA